MAAFTHAVVLVRHTGSVSEPRVRQAYALL